MLTKKPNFHEIEIRPKASAEGLLTGANAEVLIDGVRLKGVTSAHLSVDATSVAKVHLQLIGNIRVKGSGEVELVAKEESDA